MKKEDNIVDCKSTKLKKFRVFQIVLSIITVVAVYLIDIYLYEKFITSEFIIFILFVSTFIAFDIVEDTLVKRLLNKEWFVNLFSDK